MDYIEAAPSNLVPTQERRCRDRKPWQPLRRAEDARPKSDYISDREQELLNLIDGHIFRLLIKRERELEAQGAE
jgi:hypothetical protein